MVPQEARGSAKDPRAPAGGLGRGQRRGRGLRPAGRQRGLPALVALLASAPQDALAAPLRGRSFLGTPGMECLRAQGTDSPSQAARDKVSQPGPPPPPGPRPGPGPHGSVLPGVCVERCYVLAPRRRGFPPARGLPRPLRPSLSFRLRGPEAGVGARTGRAGAGGGRAGGGLPRALSRARSRCRCCPRLRGRPAGLGARDLRGGCGSRPFSNLIGLVVMWSAEASTITRGMFS